MQKESNSKSLEIACGTGRLYLPLLEQGFDIHAIDISGDMLDILRQKAKSKNIDPIVYKKDVTKMDLDEKYDLIYYPFNSITHLSELENQRDAIKNIYAHLKENGTFALDIVDNNLSHLSDYGRMNERIKEIDGTEYKLEFWHSNHSGPIDKFNWNNRIINTETRNIVFETSFELGLIPKNQLKLLLIDAGFEDYEFIHNSENGRFRIIAQK